MPTATVPLLLHELVDDAALFPPGNAAMPDALPSHRAHRSEKYSGLLGPFLCPASRISELTRELSAETTMRLGLIFDTGVAGLPQALEAVAADDRLKLEIVEIPLPKDADLVDAARVVLAALPDVTSYVELPRMPGWEAALELVAEAGRGAKLRTGGLVAEAFPTEAEVADFMLACAGRGVRFKCTAGLHNALRHTASETGFEHHGFLNVLVAAERAARGATREELIGLLAEREAAALIAAYRGLGDARRELFASYGSCSFDEPVEDLRALGLLA
jgi:hypothetical protein